MGLLKKLFGTSSEKELKAIRPIVDKIEALDGEDIVTCLDGEAVANRSITLRLSGQKVNFFGPAGCDPNATAWEDPTLL